MKVYDAFNVQIQICLKKGITQIADPRCRSTLCAVFFVVLLYYFCNFYRRSGKIGGYSNRIKNRIKLETGCECGDFTLKGFNFLLTALKYKAHYAPKSTLICTINRIFIHMQTPFSKRFKMLNRFIDLKSLFSNTLKTSQTAQSHLYCMYFLKTTSV